jgi:hypothetical protein
VQPIQIYAFTPPSPTDGSYVKFLQAFKMFDGNVELRIRNSEGGQNSIEITPEQVIELSLALGAAKFPYEVIKERGK